MEDAAVMKATGKHWKQWFALLDKAGAEKMSHRDIANAVQEKYLRIKAKSSVVTNAGWWSQMITVEYERARGLRTQNQNEFGYNVSMHKTVSMPVKDLVKVWEKLSKSTTVARKRLELLPSKTKRMQLRYKAAEGRVVVSFDERAAGRSRICVEVVRLTQKSAVERERKFWKAILEKIS